MSPAKSRKGEPGTVREFMSVNLVSCHRIARKRCGPPLDRPTILSPFSLMPLAVLRRSPGILPRDFIPPALVQMKASKTTGNCGARGRVGKADDRSLIIDRCGRVPGIASDVAK